MNTEHQHWTISNGWIPPIGDQTVGFLNVSSEEAHVQIFIYYSNRDPVGPYRLILPAKRVRQVPFNCLTDPEPIPRATDYAATIDSDVPIVIQHAGTLSQETDEDLTAYGK
jgi:hypothetical protein